MTISFEGEGPYQLPVAQSITVENAGNQVVAYIRLLAEPDRMETVQLLMLPDQALELSSGLQRAIPEALRWQMENRR